MIDKLDQIEQLREVQESMQNAFEALDIMYFEYFPETNRAVEYNGREKIGLEKYLENYPECWFERHITMEEDEPVLRNAFQRMKNGEAQVTCNVRNCVGGQLFWHHYTFTASYDTVQKERKVLCTAQDITPQKAAEHRIQEEKKYQEAIDAENLISKARSNLTRNIVEEYRTREPLLEIKDGESYDGFVDKIAMTAYDPKETGELRVLLAKEKLTELFHQNEWHYTRDYRRKKTDGTYLWVHTLFRIMEDPETHDLIAFTYIFDVNREKMMEQTLSRIAELDYEVLSMIHTKTESIQNVRTSEIEQKLGMLDGISYCDWKDIFIQNLFLQEDWETMSEQFDLKHIHQQLEENGMCEIVYSICWNKEIYRKRWKFFYLDEAKDVILLTRSDMTELFKQQEQQKEDLRNALIQAEQASNAKSDFLSRMSHEIRTPMNAIIGMSALAAQCVADPKQVMDCISKIGISARFLLSLINDILDMSRIESGKVTLRNEKFPFEELVNNVNTIIYEQASQKNIDYDCLITSFTSRYYIGDSMKLQQVLVNLLGNAVKFTKNSGKVQLVIRQEKRALDQVVLVFSVNDTGIGISERAQKVIFDPFEQGDSTITTPYKGTGLGLAISKNLVNMMGGTISLNSIEGIGSEFTVRIPMGYCEDEMPYEKLELPLSLGKLNTLIVDDDITICEHTKELLSEMGMEAEWVESGMKAVELVKAKLQLMHSFDIILVDWKMPDMDGIETTRRIRKLVGPDVTIIVMTAYDWAEIEHDAKLAGVNLLVSKPLFKSSLISVFERIYNQKEQEKVKKDSVEYDFTGKHILLVEDHILNVEVARRLMEAKGIEVEVAENGLQAIEAFTSAKDGYFDAILMDIRMPVMDGLTASRSIRQLRKAGSKTVPIIAMSANAFDEDVEKSKSAGMNEHLSKPIDPPILYATLKHWFDQGQEH